MGFRSSTKSKRRRSCCGCRGNDCEEFCYCLCHIHADLGIGWTPGEEWEFSCRWTRLRKLSGAPCAECGETFLLPGSWVYRRVVTEDGKVSNADFAPECCEHMCGGQQDEIDIALISNVNHGVLPGSFADIFMLRGRKRLIESRVKLIDEAESCGAKLQLLEADQVMILIESSPTVKSIIGSAK